MNGISLYTGGGIGELAIRNIIPDYRTVAYVEWDSYCKKLLRARIRDGVLDDAPIFSDVREFNRDWAELYCGKVDFISGGFPCQPFSVAGKRKGEADERNMWPATVECIRILRPRFAFMENVPGLFTHKYIRRIFGDLAEIGYDAQWLPLSAAEVGANHKREREWILAYPGSASNIGGQGPDKNSHGISEISRPAVCSRKSGGTGDVADSGCGSAGSIQYQSQPECNQKANIGESSQTLADTETGRYKRRRPDEMGERREMADGITRGGEVISDPTGDGCNKRRKSIASAGSDGIIRSDWWSVEPDLGRVAHGVANRVDRLKMLGNGWVPQVVARILQVNK